MSQVSNHTPEVLLERPARITETEAHDLILLELDYSSGLWFPDDDYDSEERARLDDEAEAAMLEAIRLSGVPY